MLGAATVRRIEDKGGVLVGQGAYAVCQEHAGGVSHPGNSDYQRVSANRRITLRNHSLNLNKYIREPLRRISFSKNVGHSFFEGELLSIY